jgi:capsule polysaccharide export protein KpsE/RkpR
MQDRSLDILDYLIIFLKKKKILIFLTIVIFILSYLTVYFFIDEEYESTAIIVPTGEISISGLSNLMKDLKNLPLGLGGDYKSGETDLYITLIYSRNTLEDLIKKFNLLDDYKLESIEEATKTLRGKIFAEENDENAFEITVRAKSRQKAADMVNYLLDYLNNKVIEFNVNKSRNNRKFIEQRYYDILHKLASAEDSLQEYQEESGMFEAKEQLKLILGAYSELETDVLNKEIEYLFLNEILPEDSPQLEQIKKQFYLYKNQLEEIKNKGKDDSFFLPYNSLPKKSKNYLRHVRDVEVYNTFLEFIIPLYEQAKFEEQKNIPILQVIDRGYIPEKKSYPPRLLYSATATIVVISFILFFLILREIVNNSQNPKIIYIRDQLKRKK